MFNKKGTKHALLMSVLSLLLCCSMLIGTTFAWFTDTASTAVNSIQSGTLDIVLEMWNGTEWVDAEGEVLNFITADGRTEDILWEPGCTYELPKIRVRNNGNLALKYEIVITGLTGDAKLLEVIDFTVNDATLLSTYTGVLLENEEVSEEMLIKGHMKEEAGNDYQNLTIDGIGITVYATQMTHENDSYGPDYDNDAFYADVYVTTEEELREALALPGSGVIGLMNDINVDADNTIVINNSSSGFARTASTKTIDLNGHTIAGTSEESGSNRNMFDVRGTLTIKNGTITLEHTGENMGWSGSTNVINITAGGVVNLENATIKNLGGSDMAFGVHMNNWGEVTLNVDNSTIFSTYCAVRVFNSGSDMNNVTITNSKLLANRALWVHMYTAADFGDKYDEVAIESRLNINILSDVIDTENTLNNTENLNADANNTVLGSVSYGFTDREVYYTTSSTIVNSADDLADALKDAEAGDTLILNDGEYTNVSLGSVADGVVIEGNGATITPAEGSNKAITGTIQGVTVRDLTISGPSGVRYSYINGDVVFENCVFEATSTYAYHTDGGSGTITFNNCVFYGWVSYGSAVTHVTFNDCELYGNGKYATVRAWCDTEMNNCHIDHTAAYLDDDYSEGVIANGDAIVTMNDCTQVIANVSGLENALASGEDVVLTDDVTADEPLVVVGGTVDGNGQTITANSGDSAYESGVTVQEGTLQNVTVTDAFRGLGTGGSGQYEMTGDVTYKNVTVTGATYGINIGVGNGYTLTVIDSTICEWNSYSGLSGAQFTNCTFTSENRYYASQRISADATFTYTNCNFEQNKYNNVDGSDNYYLNSYNGTGTIVFENCYMDGVLVTEENVATLFQIDGVTVVVKNG